MNSKERLQYYEDNYDILYGGFLGRGKKIFIGKKNQKCRFCFRDNKSTTFRNSSHAIPELLGNKQLILLNECDECNTFFADELEDHLDKYTKPIRLTSLIKGKTRIPKYRSFDKMDRIEFSEMLTVKSSANSKIICVNEKEKVLNINMDVEPYLPVAVYKAFVKMALSIINDEDELGAFQNTIKWIKNVNHSQFILYPLKIMKMRIPGLILNSLFVLMMRRKDDRKVPYSLFIITIGNYVYQMIIPSEKDLLWGEDLEFAIPFPPMPYNQNILSGKPECQVEDFSGIDIVKRKISISFRYEERLVVKSIINK